ncbi:MAG: FAD-dependent monooxygenase [Rhizobiales bacterium]|nr:FAD-dependent monooxygenase [Hyphomicrobiales bacterium]
MAKSRTIVVSGAGIAGLSAALCLAKCGFRVLVFDKAKSFDTVGAGIQLSPNAIRALDEMGVGKQIRNSSFAPNGIDIHSASSGKIINTVPLGADVQRRYGLPYLTIHRSDLHSVLLSACNLTADIHIKTNCSVDEISTHLRGASVIINDGTSIDTISAKAVIIADGVKSKLRETILSDAPVEHSGYEAWRAMLPRELVPDYIDNDFCHLSLGSNKHIVFYPVNTGRYVNMVFVTRSKLSLNDADRNKVRKNADPKQLLKGLSRTSKEIKALTELPIDWSVYPLLKAPALKKWGKGNVIAIGDAAHGMVPFAAQGAAMAIEDAIVLADQLNTNKNTKSAIKAYEKIRRPRIKKITKLSNTNGELYHMGFPFNIVRDFIISNTKPEKLLSRQHWIYKWEPPKLG